MRPEDAEGLVHAVLSQPADIGRCDGHWAGRLQGPRRSARWPHLDAPLRKAARKSRSRSQCNCDDWSADSCAGILLRNRSNVFDFRGRRRARALAGFEQLSPRMEGARGIPTGPRHRDRFPDPAARAFGALFSVAGQGAARRERFVRRLPSRKDRPCPRSAWIDPAVPQNAG